MKDEDDDNPLQSLKKHEQPIENHLGVSKNRGTPKSSILIGFSIINHPFWGTPYCWNHPPGKISNQKPFILDSYLPTPCWESHHIYTTWSAQADQWHGCSNGSLVTKKPAVALEDSLGGQNFDPQNAGNSPSGVHELLNHASILIF